MTLIEFFDESSVDNIAGAILCEAERVIFVGDNRRKMEESITLYEKILRKRGLNTVLKCETVNRNDLDDIISVLSGIVKKYEDCTFDLNGGDELCFVAVGVMLERYKSKIQCHRYNLKTGKLNDADADGKLCEIHPFEMTVEETVNIYGGRIVNKRTRDADEAFTYDWDFSEKFSDDIETMWDICKENPKLWNAHISTLGLIVRYTSPEDGLHIKFDKDVARVWSEQNREKFVFITKMMYRLEQKRLIHSLSLGDKVSFYFKNKQVKRCLTVAGQILELVVATKMRRLTDKKGKPFYNDIRVGVVIDWDAVVKRGSVKTVNEIDVFAMKGMIPIFISCKNGGVDTEELYKLNSVARRFGGRYAKKALVTPELEKLGGKAEYLRARMEDMDILCIENIDEMDDNEIDKLLSALAND